MTKKLEDSQRVRQVARCGTSAGYNKHLRLKESTCQSCRNVHAENLRKWSAANRDKAKKIWDKNNKRRRDMVKDITDADFA